MATRHSLSAEGREFLALVAGAAFANPFSEERAGMDAAIAGLPRSAAADRRVDAAIERVRAFLSGLPDGRRGDLRGYAPEDRARLMPAHLFDAFHQFIDPLDALIRQQIADADTPTPVPFAADTLAALSNRGFGRDEALRALALFYQLRRAYHFITEDLTGSSPCMQALRLALWDNVFTHDVRIYERHLWNRMEDFSTLLLGETGSGKGAAAAAIGRSGFIPYDERRGVFAESFARSFVAINLSQYPETLIESELFGHRKGAFTGAVEAHEGVFQRCSPHGAIFLDEIGDVPAHIQIKLLQVLQDRVFVPVGSHTRLRFRGRVIAATNRPLDDLRARGMFRDDLFYRLCSDLIVVPPLRQRLAERPEELHDLVAVTVHRLAGASAGEIAELVCRAVERDLGAAYPWPGNVRELEQCVRRVILTRRYAGDRRPASRDAAAGLAAGIADGTLSARALLTAYCRLLHERYGTYEEVARRTGLDRRTAKRYVTAAASDE